MFELRDPVSSGSHFLMSIWALFATLILQRLTHGDRSRQVSVTIFGLSMVLLYFASGLFHGLRIPWSQLVLFQKFDQSAIYILIAGTCTPIMAILLTGAFRRWLLGGIWLLAFVGIACLWLLPKMPHSATVGLYLGMGWFGMVGTWRYFQAVGWRGMIWALAGDALYTLGAVMELAQWPVIWPGVIRAHEMLHLCDMVATYCHFVFIVRFVIPYRPLQSHILLQPQVAQPALALEA